MNQNASCVYNIVAKSNRIIRYDILNNINSSYIIEGVQEFYEYSSICELAHHTLCISGGVKNAIPVNKYYIVDLNTQTLKTKGSLIHARSEHFSTGYGNKIFHFFGESSDGVCEYTDLTSNRQIKFYQNSSIGQSVGCRDQHRFYIASAFLDLYMEYDAIKDRMSFHRCSLPSPQEVVTISYNSDYLYILYHEYIICIHLDPYSFNIYNLNIKGCRWCPIHAVYQESVLYYMDFRSKTFKLKLSSLV